MKNTLILLSFVLIAGCTSMPDLTASSKLNMDYLKGNLIIGKTTEADTIRLLGDPLNKSQDPSGNDYWRYTSDQGNIAKDVVGFLPIPTLVGNQVGDARKTKSLGINFTHGVVSNWHLYLPNANQSY